MTPLSRFVNCIATPSSSAATTPAGRGDSTTRAAAMASVAASDARTQGAPIAALSVRLRTWQRAVCAAASVVAVLCGGAFLAATPAQADVIPPYEIKSFTSRTTDVTEADYTQAGGHPHQNQTTFELSNHVNSGGEVVPNEELKDAFVTLEPGFIGNPSVAPRCQISDIAEPVTLGIPDRCPAGSQVGTVFARILSQPVGGAPAERPIYNLVTERGYPAQFAFRVGGTITVLSVVPLPRTESYGLTIGAKNPPLLARVNSFSTIFCSYGASAPPGASCKEPAGVPGAPFLSNPLDCSNPHPAWKLAADSWENPGGYLPNGLPDLANPGWLNASVTSPQVTGCDDPLLATQFNSTTIATKLLQPGAGAIQADQPSGLAVDLDFPQSNDPTDLDTEFEPDTPQAPEPKDITVKLPAGLSISPSSADGLGACSDLASDPAGDQVHYDTTKPVTCPDSSKIGSAVATSPLLALRDPDDDHVIGPEPIPGDVYLLKPHPGDLVDGQDREVPPLDPTRKCRSWRQLQASGDRARRQADRPADHRFRRKSAAPVQSPHRGPQGWSLRFARKPRDLRKIRLRRSPRALG